MSADVIYPSKFSKTPVLQDRVLSKEVAVNIYSALLNLYHTANNGFMAQSVLVAKMTQESRRSF